MPAWTGCDTARIDRLEKENAELKAKADQADVAREFDLQAKCAKDARAWFNESYARDKDTQLLDFTNHYNKKENACFVFVEWHFSQGESLSWVNLMSLWNVYENSKYGNFGENHYVDLKHPPTRDEMITCEVMDKKCKSAGEFIEFIGPYLAN